MPRKDQYSITFYFSTPEEEQEWSEEANRYCMPVSNYLRKMVEIGRTTQASEEEKLITPNETDALQREAAFLRKELREKSVLLESREAELYKLKHGGFSIIDSEKAKEYDSALVELLKRGRTVDGRQILQVLKIPPQDGEAMRLVYNQLEELRRFGLIKETPNGWRWIK
jgi:hypothetical protein